MKKIEITSVSSRGQIVIPQEVRKKLNLDPGDKLIVIGEGDTIILKKVEVPSFKGVDKLLKKQKNSAKR